MKPNRLKKAYENKRLRGSRLGKISQEKQRKDRATRIIEVDTVRMRTLDSARGSTIRHGVTYTANAAVSWEIRSSVKGRLDQVDLVLDGEVAAITGLRNLERGMKRQRIN